MRANIDIQFFPFQIGVSNAVVVLYIILLLAPLHSSSIFYLSDAWSYAIVYFVCILFNIAIL
jgi:hypothetical protein